LQNINEETGATETSQAESPPTNTGNLAQRTATAILLIPAFILINWIGGWWFTLALILMAILMHQEWQKISPRQNFKWKFLGISYIAVPIASAIALRNFSYSASDGAGFYALLYLVAVVVATDVGAYFSGRRFGSRKLAPAISPNKTWAGLYGGIVCAIGISWVLLSYTPWPEGYLSAALMAVIIAILAQLGDLFESWMKRQSGVKDSGTLLPGHGGVLDRLDGYILPLPFYTFMVWLNADLLP
jgi:phosphatidate cytidylyltransferase